MKADRNFTIKYYGVRVVVYLFSVVSRFIDCFNAPKRGYIPTTGNPLLLESATKLSREIRSGRIKSRDVVEAYVQRIKEVQPFLNAVIDERFEEAHKEASQIDADIERRLAAKLSPAPDEDGGEEENKPLLGLPFTCKDSIAVKGMLFTAGHVPKRGTRAEEDAPVIARLRRAGAIPIAITNVPELGLYWDSNNNLYGRTNNPYDLSRIPGGSSGGEAALICSAGSLFGVASDLAGSIRIPAYCCGIFGHKPTPFLIPTGGMFPRTNAGVEQYLVFGPLARNVSDLKLLFKAMIDEDQLPKLRLDEPVDLKSIKIYYMQDDAGNPLSSPVSDEIKQAMDRAIDHFKETYGVHAEMVSYKQMLLSIAMWSASLQEIGLKTMGQIISENTGRPFNVFWELFKWIWGRCDHPINILMLCLGDMFLKSKPGSAQSIGFKTMAENLRSQLIQKLDANGVFFYPTLPEMPPTHYSTTLKPFDLGYAAVINALGLAATHCPLGLSRVGLPIGFQVVAGPSNDRLTLAVAEELEKTFGGWVPPFAPNAYGGEGEGAKL